MAGHLGSNELNLLIYKYLVESGEAVGLRSNRGNDRYCILSWTEGLSTVLQASNTRPLPLGMSLWCTEMEFMRRTSRLPASSASSRRASSTWSLRQILMRSFSCCIAPWSDRNCLSEGQCDLQELKKDVSLDKHPRPGQCPMSAVSNHAGCQVQHVPFSSRPTTAPSPDAVRHSKSHIQPAALLGRMPSHT